jgi:hypothetical protein
MCLLTWKRSFVNFFQPIVRKCWSLELCSTKVIQAGSQRVVLHNLIISSRSVILALLYNKFITGPNENKKLIEKSMILLNTLILWNYYEIMNTITTDTCYCVICLKCSIILSYSKYISDEVTVPQYRTLRVRIIWLGTTVRPPYFADFGRKNLGP